MRMILVAVFALAIDVFADPQGAVEFEIDRPNNPGGTVVRAADFGVSPATADNTSALNRALEHCRASGAARLVIGKGTYRCTSDCAIKLEKMKDFVFDGAGADFIFFRKKDANFRVINCERIELRNFSVDWDWERDPLGSIVEIAGVTSTNVDFRFVHYQDFPRKDVRCAYMSPWDAEVEQVGGPGLDGGFSIDMSWGGDKRPHPPREWLRGNLLRVCWKPDAFVKPGQLYRMMHYYYDLGGFSLGSVSHLFMENIEIKSNPGHAIVVWGKSHHWHLRNVNIRRPVGEVRRGVTCTADHFHVDRSLGFGKLENCEFSLGGDDCVNLHDSTCYVPERIDDHTVRGIHNGRLFSVGDTVELRYADMRPTGVRTKVTALREVVGRKDETDIVLEAAVPPKEGFGYVLFNRSVSGHNMILRNCFFHGNRARGVIVQVPDVTIENCRFWHNEMQALNCSSGWTYKLWSEGTGVSNLVVRGCTFESGNPDRRKRGEWVQTICFDTYARWPGHSLKETYPILQDILFDRNVFSNDFGLIGSFASVSNLVFRDTRVIVGDGKPEPLAYRAGFVASENCDVRLLNTKWENVPVNWNPQLKGVKTCK